MIITWLGEYTLKIATNNTTLLIDPYSPQTGLKALRAKANIVALSNPTASYMSHLSGIQGDITLIDTPGEYSLVGYTLHALGWHDNEGNERNLQRWQIDGITLLYLGALNRELTDSELQHLEQTNIDILILPIGGHDSLNTQQALSILGIIEPRIVIPIHYQLPHLKQKLDSVDQFAKELGVNPKETQPKLTTSVSKLPSDGLATVILTPSNV